MMKLNRKTLRKMIVESLKESFAFGSHPTQKKWAPKPLHPEIQKVFDDPSLSNEEKLAFQKEFYRKQLELKDKENARKLEKLKRYNNIKVDADLDILDMQEIQKEKISLIKRQIAGPLSDEDEFRLMQLLKIEDEVKAKRAKTQDFRDYEDPNNQSDMAKRWRRHKKELAEKESALEKEHQRREKRNKEFLEKFQQHLNRQGKK